MEQNKTPIIAPADWGGSKSNTHYAWIDDKVHAIRPTKDFVLYKGRWRPMHHDGMGGAYVDGPDFLVHFEIKEFDKSDTEQNATTSGFFKTLPWRIASQNYLSCFYHIVGKDGDRELKILSLNDGPHPIKEHRHRIRDNASAIVSAVNNTYGAGINPEAITDLLKAAQDFVSKVEEGKAKSKESYSKFKAAIEKAKL